MAEDYRLHQALTALHAGVTALRAEDTDLSLGVDELLPTEAADVEAALLGVLRSSRRADALAKAAKEMATDMSDRASRFKARSDRLRGIAFAAMDALGKRKIEAPDLTASVVAGRASLIVTDEAAIPDEYWVTTRAVSKTLIAEAMKEGVVVPGVETSNSLPSLQIRSR